MMKKLAKVGYRVAPMYNDEPNGTIVEVPETRFTWERVYVMVKWDNDSNVAVQEQIKYLRKGI